MSGMLRRSLIERLPAAVLLLLHLLVLVLLPLADMRLDAAGFEQSVHIETSHNDCPTPHNDLACQICQTLRAPVRTPPTGDPVPVACPAVPAPASVYAAALPSEQFRQSTLHSRAPPRSSI